MQVSKWTFLACSTAAIVVWALYKMVRFYQSGVGKEFMKPKDQNSASSAQAEQKNRDTDAS